MTTPFSVSRKGMILRPISRWSEEMFAELPQDRDLLCQITQPRNPKQNDKFHAVAAVVAENDPDFLDGDRAIEWAKWKMGLISYVRDWGDTTVIQTKSTNFASMGQVEFNRVYKRAMYLWSTRLGVDAETLGKEAHEANGY